MARKLALPGAAMPIKWVLNCAGLLVFGNYTSKLTVITGDNRRLHDDKLQTLSQRDS